MGKNKKIYLVPDPVPGPTRERCYRVSRTENLVRPIFGESLTESEVLNWIRDPDILVVISGSSRLYKPKEKTVYRPLLAHGEE